MNRDASHTNRLSGNGRTYIPSGQCPLPSREAYSTEMVVFAIMLVFAACVMVVVKNEDNLALIVTCKTQPYSDGIRRPRVIGCVAALNVQAGWGIRLNVV